MVFGSDTCLHRFNSLVALSFDPLSRRDLIDETLLVRVLFRLEGLMVGFELGKQLGHLVLLRRSVFVELGDRGQSPFNLCFLLEELLQIFEGSYASRL